MDIAVLGAAGTLGHHLVTHLEAAGHTVRALGRRTGVDAVTGDGLTEALQGTELVIDAISTPSLSARRAVETHTRAAGNISRAAEQGGARRVLCVSIAGAADPEVHRYFAYYRGKAAQEATYLDAALPVTLVRSTQWFEIAGLLLSQASLGPVALLPTMRMAPVAAERLAARIAREVESDEDSADRAFALRGPKELTSAQLVRRILARRGSIDGRSPRLVAELPYLGSAIAGGGLIPADAEVDDMDLEEWLRTTA
ncbi:SDR family oxidoreductase [Brachybacterium sp. AOP3-A1-3]|uniref:SDR family oxidoreductase n=1 Tax=Brachybacterium sp. AOP3-A1-3 TaxID=3457699 RepID=UPI004034B620